ncbi:Flp pilus assembly protein CpaB [Celeribacter sp. PS-C1]|uniref:Flp pilus assembly protein CpaB n=1 Tax=Celeribacter sp. PS-C1 TaxID=2820813 RepID=UPI001CA5145B|nr:Flp pilus assembly protein CpaB [Celeribacter sp. PS-C1]MBW6417791.1 Flp pilus assembly protein CpaB [Celeribacter sp. PS-C1]
MRFTTAASFLIAAILAIGAVFGAQRWLSSERLQIQSDVQREMQAQQEVKAAQATIVVADKAISFGEQIEPNILREIEWSSDVFPEGAFAKISDVVVGQNVDQQRFALTQIAFGEPVLASKITIPGQRAKLSTALSPGLKAVSIRVNDVLGVAGFVLPGDRVDVMITRGRGGSAFVDVLLQGVRVIAIDQTADDSRDKPSVVRTVTFEVSTSEAQKLVLGSNVGTLSLALRNAGSGEIERIERVTAADLNDDDVADDLIEAALNTQTSAETERLNRLEEQLQALSELRAQQDAALSAQSEAVPVSATIPFETRTSVGVIRDGSRKEYKVLRGASSQGEAGSAANVDMIQAVDTRAEAGTE